MSSHLTRMHLALGLPASPITFDLIESAVNAQIPESSDLEWKSRVAPPGTEKAGPEFAKDVAALANGEGGTIVFGVEERRGVGTAESIAPIDISESVILRLRAWAAEYARPYITGIEIVPLTLADNPTAGLIAVFVPPSPHVPHFVGRDGEFRAPIRDGAGTRWQREPEIARAYSLRFATAASLEAQLVEDVRQVVRGLPRAEKTWLVASARPEYSARALSASLTQGDFAAIVATARARSRDLTAPKFSHSSLMYLENQTYNSRTDLRRRVAEDRWQNDVAEVGNTIRLALYDDGAVSLCFSAFQDFPLEDEAYVDVLLLEMFARDIVALICAAAENRGLATRYVTRIEILEATRPTSGLRIWGPRRQGSFTFDPTVLEGSRVLIDSLPITATVDPGASAVDALHTAKSLALDVLNQFSVESTMSFAAS